MNLYTRDNQILIMMLINVWVVCWLIKKWHCLVCVFFFGRRRGLHLLSRCKYLPVWYADPRGRTGSQAGGYIAGRWHWPCWCHWTDWHSVLVWQSIHQWRQRWAALCPAVQVYCVLASLFNLIYLPKIIRAFWCQHMLLCLVVSSIRLVRKVNPADSDDWCCICLSMQGTISLHWCWQLLQHHCQRLLTTRWVS